MNPKIRVFIVDDHEVLIDGLMKSLSDSPEFAFAGRAVSAEELLEKLVATHDAVDLILMDIRMPPGMNGFEATVKVKELYPQIKVIVLTGALGRLPMAEAVRHHAEGYISKSRSTKELLEGMQRVMNGEFIFLPDNNAAPDTNVLSIQAPDLTRLEEDVLCRTVRGETADEVSVALKMTSYNVDRIRRNLMSKFSVRNVAELSHVATKMGFCQGQGNEAF